MNRRLLAVYAVCAALAVLVVVLIAYGGRGGHGGTPFPAVENNAEPEAPREIERDSAPQPANAPTPGSLWQPVAPELAAIVASQLDGPPAAPDYADVEGRALVRLVNRGRRLAVGDRLDVRLPQLGETYSPVVERVQNGPGATRSVTGLATDDDGGKHRFIYTVGPRSTYATIGTRAGVFELVANAELGWLMPAANMYRNVDYSKPDYYVVRPGGPDRPGR